MWRCKSSDQIIETFFKILKIKLEPFSFSISDQLKDYSHHLIKTSKNEYIKSVSEVFFPSPSIEAMYDSINGEIKRIGKKIIVLVDDIDRLDKEEFMKSYV